VPLTAQREDYSAAGPFLTIAVDGSYAIGRRWSLNARAQFLRLTIRDSSGELGDYHADVQFRAWPNLAFGAGYEYRRAAVELVRASPSGTVRMLIDGPELFARLAF
jgi:hypothetical protein